MGSYPATRYCYQYIWPPWYSVPFPDPYVNLTNLDARSLQRFCNDVQNCESNSEMEAKYSQPMVLIGIYISVASLFCILAMGLDLYGFRSKKFWFPTKYFSLNAASITVITVAMKLPVDLSSPMQGNVDQVAKIGSLAFMCTMISNLMPSLASMENKSLVANVIGLSILVITLIVNVFIQIRTEVIDFSTVGSVMPNYSMVMVTCIYMGILLFLLTIMISSAVTIPTAKTILEFKYQATSTTTLTDLDSQENKMSIVEKLRQLVKRNFIMAKTGSPQFVMASNASSSAYGILCAISMLMHTYMVGRLFLWGYTLAYTSVYKWTTIAIVVTQSIGVVVGAIAPISRCFILLSFKSFDSNNRKPFLVFKVEKYWTQKLCEWKESSISFSSTSRRSRALLYNLIIHILTLCVGFQKVIVVFCKITGLIPIVVIIFFTYCSCYFKFVKLKFFTPPPASSSGDTNEDLSNYVLLLEDNMQLAEKTIKGITNSMNRLIHNAEKKQHSNLLKLLENSIAFKGVETFDNDQIQSLLSVEPVNSWSLAVGNLTCMAVALPNVNKDKVEDLLKSVSEGLLYTHLVEESLNNTSEYESIRRATIAVWHRVEYKWKWLEISLERSAYGGKTPIEVVKSFARKAEEIVTEFNKSTDGEVVEKKSLPLKVITANSMYRIAKTIMHTYESNNLRIVDDELFTRLSTTIADILAACLTNLPQVITLRCQESAIEKREASVVTAVDLLGRTTEIIKRLDTRDLPNMNHDKMGFIDEWRLYLKQP